MERTSPNGFAAHGRTAGFDALRLLAVVAVFYQHACTLLDADNWTTFHGLRIGRFGTAIFLGLSGYLAAITTRPPGRWLWERARKLFPAYWVVLALSFAAAAATGYKSFDAAQVFCQFAGIGLFTHQAQLVNVTMWFVSALFALYVVAYVGMKTHGVAVGVALLAALAIGIEQSSTFETVAVHSVTFLAAYLVGRSDWPRGVAFIVGAGAFAGVSLAAPEFRYGALAFVGLALATAWRGDWHGGRVVAANAYEWFLVHGLCLHAVIRIVGTEAALVFPIAAGVSIVAAVGLRRGIEWAGRLFATPIRWPFHLPLGGNRVMINKHAETAP